MAYGSLAYGMLTGTFNEEMAFEKNDWRSRRGNLGNINLFQHLFGPDHFLKNLRAVEELKAMAKRYGKSLPQFALRWTLSDADMKEIDAIFGRHGAITTPDTWLETV